MMFKSDSQRRACFANLFSKSNRFALYAEFKKDDKNQCHIKSDEYPEVDVDVFVFRKGKKKILEYFNIVPEHDLAYLSNAFIVPYEASGFDDREGEFGYTEDESHSPYVDIGEHFDFGDTYPKAVLAHEVGHYVDLGKLKRKLPSKVMMERVAGSYQDKVYPQDYMCYDNYPSTVKSDERLEFKMALAEQVPITFDEAKKYAGEFSKKRTSTKIELDFNNEEMKRYFELRSRVFDKTSDGSARSVAKKELNDYLESLGERDHKSVEEEI